MAQLRFRNVSSKEASRAPYPLRQQPESQEAAGLSCSVCRLKRWRSDASGQEERAISPWRRGRTHAPFSACSFVLSWPCGWSCVQGGYISFKGVSPLTVMPVSSQIPRNTRNNVSQAVWAPLSPGKLTQKVSHHSHTLGLLWLLFEIHYLFLKWWGWSLFNLLVFSSVTIHIFIFLIGCLSFTLDIT